VKFNHGKYLEIMEMMKDTSVSFDELHKKYMEIMKEPSVSLDALENKLKLKCEYCNQANETKKRTDGLKLKNMKISLFIFI